MAKTQCGWLGLWVCIVCCGLMPTPATAALIQFNNKTNFLAQTGATAATSIPTTSPGNKGTSFTSGSLTFSVPSGPYNIQVYDFSSRLPGNELGNGGVEDFNIAVNTGPVYSFGFDFVEPRFDPNLNGTFIDSTFSVTLLNGITTVGSFNFARPNDSAQFVGVWMESGPSFNRVQIREIVGGSENEFFGQFYTGVSPTAVPEPSSLALACVAFGVGTAFCRMRRRRTQPAAVQQARRL